MIPRASPVIAAVIAVLAGTGCAVNAAGRNVWEQGDYDFTTRRAVEHAAFFHPGCAVTDIKVLRLSDDRRYLELGVCGQVRRYQDITPRNTPPSRAYPEPTWVDVTASTG